VLGKCHRVSYIVDVNKNTVRSTHSAFCFASSQALAVTVLTNHENPTSFTGLPQQLIDLPARATSAVPHVVKTSRKRKKIIHLGKTTFRTLGVFTSQYHAPQWLNYGLGDRSLVLGRGSNCWLHHCLQLGLLYQE